MISIPGSLSFAKLVMMSSTPAKSAGDTSIQSGLQSVFSSAFFLCQMQTGYLEFNTNPTNSNQFLVPPESSSKLTLQTG